MLKKINLFLTLFITLLSTLSLLKIDNKNIIVKTIKTNKPVIISKIIKQEEKPIGNIIINKIGINKPLYSINSNHNNIEENITILDGSIYPDRNNSILFIAAHSGTGEIAFFNDLDKLKINDEIIINYNNKKYTYQINNIYEQQKNGYISGIRENKKQLVLTTCCPNKDNCQLIINSTEKES